jgi:hypothetical protein
VTFPNAGPRDFYAGSGIMRAMATIYVALEGSAKEVTATTASLWRRQRSLRSIGTCFVKPGQNGSQQEPKERNCALSNLTRYTPSVAVKCSTTWPVARLRKTPSAE